VTLFEAAPRLGGHTYTVPVETERGEIGVDIGFIVFNEKNYPGFVRLLGELGVSSQESEMSFSVRCEKTGLEYRSTSLDTLFAQRRNLLSPSFHRMLLDVLRFQRRAPELLENGNGGGPTLEEYVRASGYSRRFWEHYLVPMGSAIWSAAPGNMGSFPASTLVRFFANHGFLDPSGSLRWRTIQGGSRTYVERIARPFAERTRLGTPVRAVRRHRTHVELSTDGATESFDHVVIAAHGDQALAMLADPTPAERETLGAIAFQPNDTVLHTDSGLLPRRRRAWASWNYVVPAEPRSRAEVTYYSNRLQNLKGAPPLCVTLNRRDRVRPDAVLEAVEFHHPIHTLASLRAQKRFSEISGKNRTSYCGAYWGYGFHEDGVQSALRAVKPLGVELG
jgi:predicted NAD/FAD-binding protein